MKLVPCKHLDYTEGKFGPDIELKTMAPHYPHVKYWFLGPLWTTPPEGLPPGPDRVQFCGAGRGRINGVFQCYNGEMSCYEPETPK